MCRAKLDQEPFVVPSTGHLLVDEGPELAAEMVAALILSSVSGTDHRIRQAARLTPRGQGNQPLNP